MILQNNMFFVKHILQKNVKLLWVSIVKTFSSTSDGVSGVLLELVYLYTSIHIKAPRVKKSKYLERFQEVR